MKTRFPVYITIGSLSVAAALLTWVGSAAPLGKSRPDARTAVESNAVPRSVFVPATSKTEGRDPFFPDCDCGTSRVVVKDPVTDRGPSIALVYNGVSGTAERRYAIINGRTFEQGEEQDIPTPSGARIKVRCVEIREKSVLVEIGGKQQQELFLRGN